MSSTAPEGFIAESSLFDPDGKLVRTFEGGPRTISPTSSRRSGMVAATISTPTSARAISPRRSATSATSRTAWPARTGEVIARRLEDAKLHAEVGPTFEKMTRHLRDNGVDLERNKLHLGPLLRIDPEREAFKANPDADALLSREYRRPFVVPAENAV